MRRAILLAGLTAVVLLVSACTPTQFVTIRTTIPPELDIPLYIKNVAVLEFEGHPGGSRVVSAKLEQELLNNQYYKVIERGEIAAIINEKNFQQTDLVENNEFLQEMKIKNVHAMITGSVATFHATTERGVDEHQQRYLKRAAVYNNKGKQLRAAEFAYRTIREPWIMKQGSTNATFKMMGMNGQIIASVSKGGAFSTPKIKGNAPVPTDSEALELAALDAVKKFIKKVSVWTEVAKLRLKRGKGCATGNNFAASELYAEAQQQFRAAAASIPNNFAAFYNLGITLEAQGRYADAEQEYRNALAMNARDKEIINAVKRIGQKKVNEERLKRLRELRAQ